jgi:hypothetical protein
MSLQSPLGKVRGLGSAGTGVHHWWVQRLTALALVPLAVWLLVSLLALPALDFVTLDRWHLDGESADAVRAHGQLAFEPRNAGDPRGLCP